MYEVIKYISKWNDHSMIFTSDSLKSGKTMKLSYSHIPILVPNCLKFFNLKYIINE